jgi:hypothetical protein
MTLTPECIRGQSSGKKQSKKNASTTSVPTLVLYLCSGIAFLYKYHPIFSISIIVYLNKAKLLFYQLTDRILFNQEITAEFWNKLMAIGLSDVLNVE